MPPAEVWLPVELVSVPPGPVEVVLLDPPAPPVLAPELEVALLALLALVVLEVWPPPDPPAGSPVVFTEAPPVEVELGPVPAALPVVAVELGRPEVVGAPVLLVGADVVSFPDVGSPASLDAPSEHPMAVQPNPNHRTRTERKGRIREEIRSIEKTFDGLSGNHGQVGHLN